MLHDKRKLPFSCDIPIESADTRAKMLHKKLLKPFTYDINKRKHKKCRLKWFFCGFYATSTGLKAEFSFPLSVNVV